MPVSWNNVLVYDMLIACNDPVNSAEKFNDCKKSSFPIKL